MAQSQIHAPVVEQSLLELIRHERAKALSAREWRFRLAGHGLGIRDVDGAQMVTRLPQGTDLGILPRHAI